MESDRELVADTGSKNLRNIVKTLSPLFTCTLQSGCQESLSNHRLEEIKSIPAMVNSLARDNQKWFNLVQKIQSTQVEKLEKDVRDLIHHELPVAIASAQLNRLSQLPNVPDTRNMLNAQGSSTSVIEDISNQGRSICSPLGIERLLQHERSLFVPCGVESSLQAEILCGPSGIESSQQGGSLCSPPDMPTLFLGFGEHVVNVKTSLLHDGVNVLVVTAMGGVGKSTLAAALCRDKEIREYFEERVLYFAVSECPDLRSILETMWRRIIGSPVPHFTNVEEQHKLLQLQIKSRNQPVLVVLDDICTMNHLEKLLFEGATYKTLVTTRDKNVIPNVPKMLVYELPLLQQEHALSLFCHCAFVKPTIPKSRNKELVIKVQKLCSGIPLALKVIGSSLHGKSVSVWERAEKRLSERRPSENIIHKILDTSINVLSEIKKQCFLDLGAIPQGKVIPAKALRDFWIFVRGMKSSEADMLLWDFAFCQLLDFKKNPGNSEITDDMMDGIFVYQRPLVRDFTLFLAKQENSRRLYITKTKNHLFSEWEVVSSKAQVVSIHIGEMEDIEWTKMEFLEVEVLVLCFTASEHCIPTCLHKMKNLKVLVIYTNDGAKQSRVCGFQELSQLKALHLQKLDWEGNEIVI